MQPAHHRPAAQRRVQPLIKARNYNLDIKVGEQVIHDPDELLAKYEQQQAEIQEIRHQLRDILADPLSHSARENTDGGAAVIPPFLARF